MLLIAGVPSSQALPGFLITTPPSVCVPDVIGALACEFQTKNKKQAAALELELVQYDRPHELGGCNNGGGGGIFSKVKRSVAKWIGTQKRLFPGFFVARVGF